MTSQPPTVVASVLNWNSYSDTAECIHTLKGLSYSPLEIVMVDNNSTDNSPQLLRNEFPSLNFIQNSRNLGFSEGHNETVKYALEIDADYIWILNNDISIPDYTLEQLLNVIDNKDGIGIISPHILDGSEEWFKHGWVNRKTGNSTTGWVARAMIDTFRGRSKEGLIFNDYVPFCCALISTDVFREVGLLPDQYFLYGEDVDYCLSVADNGYDVVTDPSVSIQHRPSSSSGGPNSPLINYYFARNRWLVAESIKESSRLQFMCSYLLWFILRFTMSLARQDIPSINGLIQGCRDGILKKKGKGRYP